MATISLSELLGSTVYDGSGAVSGRVREVALAPQEDRSRVASLIVKTPAGNRILPLTAVSAVDFSAGKSGIRASTPVADWAAANGAEGLLLLSRDLLDRPESCGTRDLEGRHLGHGSIMAQVDRWYLVRRS